MEDLIEPAQIDVGQQRRDHPALRRAFVTPPVAWPTIVVFLHDHRLQPLPNQLQHLAVADARRQTLHQLLVRDRVEVTEACA
jgi:hypothetical protein